MEKKHAWNLGYWLLAVLAVLWVQDLWQAAVRVEPVPYSDFEKALADGRIDEVTIGDRTITGHLKVAEGRKTTLVATRVEPDIAERLDKYGVRYTRVVESTLLRDLASWVLPALVFVGLWYFVIRRMADRQGGMGGFLSIGKSRAKVYVQTDTGVTFADVAGVDEARAELAEVVDFLKNPKQYGRLGAHIPRGVLLVGPPGTGKTLLAKAVAGEAAVPFFSISGSEFVELFVGVGAARVRDLFEQARNRAPAIIFIDELDALGRARGAYGGLGGHDEKEQTLNQLLAEMDGFDTSVGLIILAATNRPEILDPALLRAGRFDRQVLVDRPDRKGRVDILKVHVRKIALDASLSLDEVAALTPGFSGADLANLVNEAALAATRRNASAVEMRDFTVAVERIVAGLERRSRLLGDKERRWVANHEMGHALVALSMPDGDAVHKVSIIPRGIGALGYTMQRPSEDRYLTTRAEMQRRIAVLLGGRAAELEVFGEFSSGAADDLARATEIARDMVTRHGMDEGIGPVTIESPPSNLLDVAPMVATRTPVSEALQQRVDDAIRAIVAGGLEQARAVLRRHRDLLDRGAQELLQKETLDEPAIAVYAQAVRQAS